MEALLHFSVAPEESVRAESLRIEEGPFLAQMPVSQPIRSVEEPFVRESEPRPGLVGYRYESENGGRVAQLTTSGLTFSIVGAYTTWTALERDALIAFDVYQRMVGRDVPVRLSTRFINRVVIESGGGFRDSFRVELPVPPGMQATLRDFQTLVSFTDVRSGFDAAVSFEHDGPSEGGGNAALIDITVASPALVTWSPGVQVPPDVTETLALLREIKNRLFFDLLTTSAYMAYQNPT